MKRKIGEIFEYNGEWYQCIIGHCNQCSFNETGTCRFIGDPYCAYRNDKKLACFKKLEKVGEPYEFDGHLFQSYRTFEVPIFTENYATVRELGNNSKISIEIKQTKEDMEEKELNLKEFNLEAAKAGKPVCTRDGRKARIICFDAKSEQPIIALVEDNHFGEIITQHHENGAISESETRTSNSDLMMLPEKKEGWVNVYKGIDGVTFSKHPYTSKDEAIKKSGILFGRIDTIKVSWEE